MYAQNLHEEAASALKLGKGWPDESPHEEELTLLQLRNTLHLPGMLVRKAIKVRSSTFEGWQS